MSIRARSTTLARVPMLDAPYTQPPRSVLSLSNASGAPSLFHPSPTIPPPATLVPRQLLDLSYMPSRPLPAPPRPWVDPVVAQVSASDSQIPSRVTGSRAPPLSPSRSFTATSSSSFTLFIPPFPPPPPLAPSVSTFSLPSPSRSPSLSVAKSRSAFPFSASKLSKATRSATTWFAEHAARKYATEAMLEGETNTRRTAESEASAKATKIRTEEDPRRAVIQAKANEAVRSRIKWLLSRDLPNEACDTVLKKCDRICTNGGLDLSIVLQEPLIDGKPPVYWAILNGPSITLQGSEAAFHALILSLLDICQPLKETTITSIRLACMLTSNNALMQHLFWHFPVLSPLSRSDAMLLSSSGGGDVVEVDETQDGTGTFVARIQIRRFRLRMRVSKHVKLEFVTSYRIWTTTFSIATGPKTTAFGLSESRWLLSFGLCDHSMPACVDGDFLVLRRLPSIESGDTFEPTFSLPLVSNPCKLQPGHESAIKVRLDDGPMRPHLLNESLALVDYDGTLHARFNIRLTQTRHPALYPPSIDFSDRASVTSHDLTSIRIRSKPPRSPIFKTRDKGNQNVPEKEKKVYTSLRRGGR